MMSSDRHFSHSQIRTSRINALLGNKQGKLALRRRMLAHAITGPIVRLEEVLALSAELHEAYAPRLKSAIQRDLEFLVSRGILAKRCSVYYPIVTGFAPAAPD